MPVANPQKTVSVSSMHCGGTATVTLSFESAAGLACRCTDIVLMMDRSSSMTQERMTCAKAAACQFIDLVDGARNAGTRMGLVSFGNDAREDVALTSPFKALKPAVYRLTGGGHTNHRAAFETAGYMLGGHGAARKIAVMFTDGESTCSGDPEPVAQTLKDKGVEIFCIGLATDPAPLKRWASSPCCTHVACAEDLADLERAFQKIAAEVILAGARDVVIREQLMPDFKILGVHTPSAGTVRVVGPQTLVWTMDAAGLKAEPERISLSFDIVHMGSEEGQLQVNHSVAYTDRECNCLQFPRPVIEVTCSGGEIYPEPCPEPTEILVPGCRDAVHTMLPPIWLQSLGRIVQVDVTLKAVCPDKRLAVSVLLRERDAEGVTHIRGSKHILLPESGGNACRDIILRCIPFSVPEALNAGEAPNTLCRQRHFEALAIANYVDSDFQCCSAEAEIC